MEVWEIAHSLGEGMLISLEIFFLTLLFSLPLGLLISFGRMSRNLLVRTLAKLYISIMRGTPLMLQLMVVYFGPYYLFGMSISREYRLISVIIGFSLNYAAYFAEIYRAGIQSMEPGQYEAAKVLGYNRTQTFIKIIMPQVIRRILPAITNEMITLVKDTSLAFVIAVSEMFTQAKAIAAANTTMLPFLVAGAFYYVMNLLIALLMERAEKKMNYF